MAALPLELNGTGLHLPSFGAGSHYASDDNILRGHSLPPSTPPSLSSGPSTPSMSSSSILLSQGEVPQPGNPPVIFDPSELIPNHGMSEAEASAANFEAAEQAEGNIVPDDSVSDAGYESDTASSASTSLSMSVREYLFENGRRYHKFRAGRYNFPNDEVEQEREDMKHAMMKTLCQKLHYAPIGQYPQEILDIGTGTGIWAIEMGDQFESANILGIDLSPIQPDWVPPNVRFMVDDAESPWLHPRNHFDYIHTRHTVMGIKDWPRMFRRSLEHLRPGGWIEIQEIVHYPVAVDGDMPADHPVAQYWHLIREGLGNLGVDFHAASEGKLARMMDECGFTNITEKVLHVPIGTWPKNKVLKTVGLYWRTILLDGIQAIALGPLTRGCRWTPQQVELFLVRVRKAYHDNSTLMYMPLHVVYAQKPLNEYS